MTYKLSSDIDIEYNKFDINDEEINKLLKSKYLENTSLNKNRIIIGLVIGKIRENINFVFLQNDGENDLEIKEIIDIIKTPLNGDESIKITADEINGLIVQILELDFNSISEIFLCNEIEVGNFIESAEKIYKKIKK